MSQREYRQAMDADALRNYNAVLEEPKGNWHNADGMDGAGETAMPGADLPAAERVRALARHVQAESVAYQSVAVVSLQIVEKILAAERAAATAAISLAQRDKLAEMINALEQTADALRSSMSRKASKMMYACSQPAGGKKPDERSWWYALTESIHTLEMGLDAISKIVAGQPKGGAARILISVIARQLHSHHNALLFEAEEWIG